MREFITFLALALILALTAALAGPWFVDWTAHRGWVEAELSQMTQTRVRVEGGVDLKLLPVPKLSLDQVRVSSHRADGPVLDISRVRLELAAASLLRGELRFIDAELERPQLSLSLREDGSVLMPRMSAVSDSGIQIEKLSVSEGSVALRAAGRGEPMVIGGIHFSGEAASLVGPYRGSGAIRLGSEPIKWRFSTGAIEEDRLRAKVIIDESKLQPRVELDGHFGFEGDLAGGLLSFDGQSIFSGTSVVAGQSVPWRLAGALKAGHAGARMDEAELRAGEDERALVATGALTFERQPTPKAHVSFTSRQLDLDRLLGASGQAASRRLSALVSDALADRSFGEQWPFAVTAELNAPAATLAGETFSDLRSENIVVPRDVSRVKFSVQGPARSALMLDGTVETGAAAAFRGRAEVMARDIPRLSAYLAIIAPEAARIRDLPFRSVELAGDVDMSSIGAIGRQLRLRLDRSEFSGALAYTRAQGAEHARLFADLASEALDLDDLPEITGPARLVSDMNLSLALDARAVRLERFGVGNVEAGRIGLRLVKDADDIRLEKLAIENLGGASLTAQGRFGAAGAELTARVDAQRLGDLTNLLQRMAPSAGADALAERAVALSPLRLDASLRGRHLEAWDDLRFEGTARGTRFNFALKPAGTTADVTGAAENNDAGLLLRQLGFDTLPLTNQGAGRLQLRATGSADKGFSGAVSLNAARLDLSLDGTARGALAHPDLRGALRLRSTDASSFLRISGFALPDVSATLPIDLGGELVSAKGVISLDNLSGLVAGTFVNGALRNQEVDGFRRWSGQVKTDRLRLSALTSLALGVQTAAPRGGIWPEQKFLPGLAEAPRLSLDVSAGDFDLADQLTAHDAQFRLRLEQGLVAIEQARMTWAEGTLGGDVALRRDAQGASLLSKIDFKNLAWPQGPVSGRLSGHVELTSTGTSYATLAAGLAGEGQAQVVGLTVASADPAALTRLMAGVDRGQVNLDERDLRSALLREFERAPFAVGQRSLAITAANGVLRLAAMEAPRISLMFDVRQWMSEAHVTPTAAAPRDWQGEPPAATLIWQGRAGAMQRSVEASSLFNAISARAIQRETLRAEALDEDIRERVAINRRAKALEFLRLRERELFLFQQNAKRPR